MKRTKCKTVKNLSATLFIALLTMVSCNNSKQNKPENNTTVLNKLNGKWDNLESTIRAQYANIDMNKIPPLYEFKLENDSTINANRNSVAGFENFKIKIDSVKKDTIYTNFRDFVFKNDTLYMVDYKYKRFIRLLKRK